MIYLNKGFFAPIFLFINIVFAPLIILCWFLTIREFDIAIFRVSLIMSLSYVFIAIGLYKYSKSQKYYLFEENDKLFIKYPNLTNESLFEIAKKQIVKIEYYRLNSIRSWCLLFYYVGPQCAYITYFENEKEICKLIGYPKFDEIKQICLNCGIELILK